MEFCPTCANLLQYEQGYIDQPARFFCRSCPYVCPFRERAVIKRGVQLPKKEMPAETEEAVRHENIGPTIDETCSKCGHEKATYEERQTRGGDEAATLFFKCMKEGCGHQWRQI